MMKAVPKILGFVLSLWIALPVGVRPAGAGVLKRTEFMMGTVVEIIVAASDRGASLDAIRGAFEEMRRVENLMSRRIKGSDVWRVNQSAGKHPVPVSRDTLSVVRVALETSLLSGGAFDVTVGALVSLWNRCWKEDRVPSREEVEGARRLVGYRDLEMDPEGETLFLKREGMELTLGGIAKGYAVDRAFEYLWDRGFRDLIVNAGGDLRTGGSKFGSPWVIGIQDPRNESSIMATMNLTEAAVATSGDYERYYMKDGVRYHHILDPFTGFPARRSRSVTVVGDELIWADALATAVFVLGPEKGRALIERLPGTEALIVDGEGKVTLSSGMGRQVRF